ncbi:MAG: DUF4250 domain-containing protein [Lachnospiraceae bacterium]|jgi:hypothetical protein|nr:DUF4250 domain-containing protein [Lachnospiraceae bacterium]MBQ5559408.1 DUF4250 domain-containing protein [Lachnospiraceae bacterium]MCR4801560.1 DUF4250 domain-containing protein [Lachnospiraceae bacterium]
MSIPKDPVMLLSFINTQLRDNYSSLDELCRSLDVDKQHVIKTLATIDYEYETAHNQFK